MKNLTVLFLRLIFGVILVLLVLTSCGDKEKEEPDQNQIIGRWELLTCEDEDYWEKPCVFRFNENNMLTITFAIGKDYECSVPCKYTIAGSKLKIDFDYGDEIFEGTYKIDHNILTFDMISYDPEDPSDVYGRDYLTLKRI